MPKQIWFSCPNLTRASISRRFRAWNSRTTLFEAAAISHARKYKQKSFRHTWLLLLLRAVLYRIPLVGNHSFWGAISLDQSRSIAAFSPSSTSRRNSDERVPTFLVSLARS